MPAAKRAEILAGFAASGMTGIAFARHIGVKYPTFAGWLRLDRLARSESKAPPVPRRAPARTRCVPKAIRLLEAAPVQAPGAGALEIVLPGGARIRVADASQLPLAVELVRSLAPC
jgi:hypothetical protein